MPTGICSRFPWVLCPVRARARWKPPAMHTRPSLGRAATSRMLPGDDTEERAWQVADLVQVFRVPSRQIAMGHRITVGSGDGRMSSSSPTHPGFYRTAPVPAATPNEVTQTSLLNEFRRLMKCAAGWVCACTAKNVPANSERGHQFDR